MYCQSIPNGVNLTQYWGENLFFRRFLRFIGIENSFEQFELICINERLWSKWLTSVCGFTGWPVLFDTFYVPHHICCGIILAKGTHRQLLPAFRAIYLKFGALKLDAYRGVRMQNGLLWPKMVTSSIFTRMCERHVKSKTLYNRIVMADDFWLGGDWFLPCTLTIYQILI